MAKQKKSYRKINIPAGTQYCVYCQGVGCDKCGGKGYYIPDTEQPIHPTPKRA